MACMHKFLGAAEHGSETNGLLPNWPIETLFIGTFNPENGWAKSNTANYYYGREKNLLWDALPRFACHPPINKMRKNDQIDFLKRNKIGITDILIQIKDAKIEDVEHTKRINSYLDKEIEKFLQFEWNTENIKDLLNAGSLKAVYFTKLGEKLKKAPVQNSFEGQMRLIERHCNLKNIPVFRLHTPSGMGLGAGKPRLNKLIQTWYFENGANHFPFLCKEFDPQKYPVTN